MTRPTFEVRGPYSGDSWGGGLSKAVEGCLFTGGLIRGAVLLFVSVIEHPHGLQGKLLSVAEARTQCYRTERTFPLFASPCPPPTDNTTPIQHECSETCLPQGSHRDPSVVRDPVTRLKRVARGWGVGGPGLQDQGLIRERARARHS